MRWAGLAAVAAIGLYGASQAPVQVQKAPEGERRAAAPEGGGADKAPSSRIMAPTKPNPARSAQESGDKKGIELGTWPDWVIVIFTAFLAWLSWRQHRLETRLAADTGDALSIARKSADAAEKSATAAVAAARATRRLVGATTASAQAAHAAVRVSEEANALMLRPYVYIVGEAIRANAIHVNLQTIVSDHAPIGFSIKNFGQTPAKRVRLKARAFIGEHWTEGGLVDLQETATIHRADLPPSFERKIEGYGANGMAEPYARILREECTVFFDGLIEYEDASGAKYETHFRRACTGRQMETGAFIITPEGNDAT